MTTDPQLAALERALGAQYEFVRLLGRGGMGAVYLARERSLERAVAIKVLPPELAADTESRERFRREARTAAKLTHPNIVPLFSFGEAEGMLYFVMGYVRGESLGARLQREGKLAPDVARQILGELANALDYAHRQGIIHRDIKPDNILLDDESGRPMLTDFGVAKARASGATLTEVGTVVGTPHYMSPEQASGERGLDGRSDLYSLGVVGYLMVSGRLPFAGESVRDVIAQHIAKAPPALKSLVPAMPPDLDAAITRALGKDPADRWADGRALALALGEAGDEDDDAGRPTLSLRGLGLAAAFVWAGAAVLGVLIRWTQFLGPRPGSPNAGPPWWLLPLVAACVPTIPAAIIALIERRRGERWADIVARFMEPPRGWFLWWPRRWRRPGDVWDRLPAPVRRFRWAYAAMMVLSVVGGATFILWWDRVAHELIPPKWMENLILIGAGGATAVVVATGAVLHRWGRAVGLRRAEAINLGVAPTAKLDLWKKPKFAALLAPPSGVEARLETPADHERAIAERAAGLTGPARDLGAAAMSSARQVVSALAELEKEIGVLARDANPTELAQIEQKVQSLGAASGDNDARRKMRGLLEGQRDLLRGLAAQLEAAQQRRSHLNELLRTLWLQVASLRADAARDALAAGEVSGKIRAVCEEIDRYADAAASLRAPGSGR